MTRRADVSSTDLPPTVRTRVRLPDAYSPSRIFQGWGPDVSGR